MCFRIHVLPLYTSAKRKHMKNILKKITKNQKPKVSDYFSSVIYVIMVFHNSYDFQNFYLIYLNFVCEITNTVCFRDRLIHTPCHCMLESLFNVCY